MSGRLVVYISNCLVKQHAILYKTITVGILSTLKASLQLSRFLITSRNQIIFFFCRWSLSKYVFTAAPHAALYLAEAAFNPFLEFGLLRFCLELFRQVIKEYNYPVRRFLLVEQLRLRIGELKFEACLA